MRWTEEQLAAHLGKPGSAVAKPNKYGAIKTESLGIKFDSKGEEKRYHDLLLLQRAGRISNLEPHPRYPLEAKGIAIKIRSKGAPNGRQCFITLDNRYIDNESGLVVVEDFKGVYSDLSKLRIAVFEALHDQQVTIVGAGAF